MGDKRELTHLNKKGEARMVDVTAKTTTLRRAVASGVVKMSRKTLLAVVAGKLPKGDVFSAARIAGIMAAKRTAELIPMCHPLNISHCEITFRKDARAITIFAEVRVAAPTGVEMEALTAVSVAALTIYDMCKSADKTLVISDVMLLEKEGGRSGTFKRKG